MNFWDQYKHPEWQKKRLECLEAANWQCQECGDESAELHVHHTTYIKGRMVWEYGTSQLQVLCGSCHKEAHSLSDAIKEELSLATSASQNFVLGYLRACNSDSEDGVECILCNDAEQASGIGAYFGIDFMHVIGLVENGSISIEAIQLILKERFRKAKLNTSQEPCNGKS